MQQKELTLLVTQTVSLCIKHYLQTRDGKANTTCDEAGLKHPMYGGASKLEKTYRF